MAPYVGRVDYKTSCRYLLSKWRWVDGDANISRIAASSAVLTALCPYCADLCSRSFLKVHRFFANMWRQRLVRRNTERPVTMSILLPDERPLCCMWVDVYQYLLSRWLCPIVYHRVWCCPKWSVHCNLVEWAGCYNVLELRFVIMRRILKVLWRPGCDWKLFCLFRCQWFFGRL
jgi:hypothetical protein